MLESPQERDEREQRHISRGLLIWSLVIIVVAGGGGVWAARMQSKQSLERRASAMTGGNPAHGRELAKSRGCGGCHEIPGVGGATGKVGPPLTAFSARVYIGGVLANTPDNLEAWLLDPPSIDSKTAMPKVGLSDQEARDVAAFLYTLD